MSPACRPRAIRRSWSTTSPRPMRRWSRSCARPARSSWASCPPTSSPSAARASICRSRRRAIRGTREHHPGGSSSGSGAGVCAGLFPLALGSDTGGSVRNPASACGIVGLKPTYGLVSRRGVFPLSFTLDHVGPMTRTVADNALLLDAIAGHDPADPGSAATGARYFGRMLDRGVRDLRIGFVRHFHETGQAGASRGDRGGRGCGARAAGRGRGGAQRHAAVAQRVRRGEPGDPVQRGLVDPRALAALASRRLRPAVAPAADAGRVHECRRLCRRAAPAAADDRRGRGGVPRLRRADLREFDGPGEPHRGRGGDRRAPIRARRARRSTSPAIRRWR